MALYPSPDYQTSFESVGFWVQMKKPNIDFRIAAILDFQSDRFYLLFDLHVTLIFQMTFRAIWPICSEEKFKIDFQHGC